MPRRFGCLAELAAKAQSKSIAVQQIGFPAREPYRFQKSLSRPGPLKAAAPAVTVSQPFCGARRQHLLPQLSADAPPTVILVYPHEQNAHRTAAAAVRDTATAAAPAESVRPGCAAMGRCHPAVPEEKPTALPSTSASHASARTAQESTRAKNCASTPSGSGKSAPRRHRLGEKRQQVVCQPVWVQGMYNRRARKPPPVYLCGRPLPSCIADCVPMAGRPSKTAPAHRVGHRARANGGSRWN